MATTARLQPVAARERIVALDVMRGFAMSACWSLIARGASARRPTRNWSPLDQALGECRRLRRRRQVLHDPRLPVRPRLLAPARPRLRRPRPRRIYRRRLAVLAAIGLAHALLLRNGDICCPRPNRLLADPVPPSVGPVCSRRRVRRPAPPLRGARAAWQAPSVSPCPSAPPRAARLTWSRMPPGSAIGTRPQSSAGRPI